MSIRVLSTLNSNAYQTVTFDTNKGERVKLTFRFVPSQETWFFDVESESLTVYGLALTAFINLLDPYHNLISWGMYVWSKDGFDPWRIDDFSTGRIRVAVTEDLENAVIQEFLNG
jgi:hypothetical protein